jgi:myo-inositol 2-dehydrogenase/D-chiro-inositol 1-dehydrogenase
MQDINVGLIGCGRIASLVYLNILKKLPGLRLAAIAESDAVNREKAGRSAPHAAQFSDYHDLLREADLTAVIICLPNHIHSEAAIASFENGKHVYLEKPIAINLTQSGEVIRAWNESDRAGMMGFNLRFNPLYTSLKGHIEAGAVGDVICVRTVFTSSGRSLPEWKKSRSTGGGALLDLASHHVDLMRYLLGNEVTQISARIRSHTTEDDIAILEYKTSDDIAVESYFSISSADQDQIEVLGTRGSLFADRYNSLNVEIITPESRRQGMPARMKNSIRSFLRSPNIRDKLFAPGREPSFEIALGRFASAVRGVEKAGPDLIDGYKCLAVLEAAEESARTGHVVIL